MNKFLLSLFFFVSAPFFLIANCSDSIMVKIYRNDDSGGPIENFSRTITRFNIAEEVISKTNFTWDGSVWIPASRDSFNYQFDTVIALHIVQMWVLNHWENYLKESYTYQNDTLITHYLKELWVGGSWQNARQTIHTYSPSNKPILLLEQNYNGGWIDGLRTDYSYDTQDNLIQETLRWWNGVGWENRNQYFHYYDADDNDTLFVSQVGDSIVWINTVQFYSHFDAIGRDTMKLRQYWNQVWLNHNRQWNYYTVASLLSDSNIIQDWNAVDSIFENDYKSIYTYDSLGRTTRIDDYSWDGTTWTAGGQYEYVYTGELLTYESHLWDTVFLGYEYYYYYYYDVHGHYIGKDGFRQGAGQSDFYNNHAFDSNGIWTGSSGWWSTQGGFTGNWAEDVYYNYINGNSSICDSGFTILSVDSCPGSTFLWSTGATTSYITVNNPGTYSVDVIYGDGYHTYTEPIDVFLFDSIPMIPQGLDSTINICANSVLTFNVNSEPGVSYQWLRNDSLLLNNQTATASFYGSQVLPGYYYLVAANSCGTDTSAKTFVNINQVPDASITPSGPVVFCAGDSVTLTADSAASYSWSPGNQTTQSILVSVQGTYTVTVSDSNGCQSFASQAVTVHQFPPAISIYQSNGTLYATYGGQFRQWYLNGDTISGANSNSYTPSQAGYYSYSSAAFLPCVVYSDSFYFDPFILSVDAGIIRYACLNGGTNIGQSTPAFGGTPPYTYQWIPTTGLNSSSLPNPYLSDVTDTLTYYLTVTDAIGLTATDSVLIILDLPPQPEIITNFGDTFCEGASARLEVTYSGGTFSVENWFVNGIAAGGGGSFYYLSHSGIYSVMISNNHACTGTSAPDTVYKLPRPAVPLVHASVDSLNCLSGVATFYVNPASGFVYNWYQYGVGLISTDTLIQTSEPAQYYLNVTDSNGCTSRNQVIEFDLDEQEIYTSINRSPYLLCDSSGITLSTPLFNGFLYQWLFNTAPISGATTHMYQAQAAGSYHFTATNSYGCQVNGGISLMTPGTSPPVSIYFFQDSLFASISAVVLEYHWYYNGTLIPDVVGSACYPAQPGIYHCTVQSYNACPSISNDYYFLVCAINNLFVSNATIYGSCDGSAAVSMNGAAPFSYSWSTGEITDSIYGLCAGTYYFTITDSLGCTVSDSVIISQPPPVCDVNVISNGDILCNGDCTGSLTTVASGFPPYHFLWSTNDTTATINNLCAGVYNVVMTDSVGCMDSLTIAVTEPPPLVAIHSTVYECTQCTTYLSVTGGTLPYSYQWCDGSIGTVLYFCGPGTCMFYITDAFGCTLIDTVVLNPPPTVSLTLLSVTGTTCAGCSDGSISTVASGGTPPYIYELNPGSIINTTGVFPGLPAGVYTVCATDVNNCTSCITDTVPDDPTVVINLPLQSGIRIFPNPFNRQTTIEISPDVLLMKPEIIITDLPGNILYSFPLVNRQTVLWRNEVASGIYFFQVKAEGKFTGNGKLVIVD